MADAEIKSEAEALKEGLTEVEIWLKKIERARKDEETWRKAGENACKIYEAGDEKDADTAFNILHSNIETLVPALYNSTPTPDVRRRFNDKDLLAKQGVDIIERAVSYSIDQYDFDGTMTEAVKDSELAGRGTARVRYEPRLEQKTGEQTKEAYEDIGYQEVKCEPVSWDRWGHGPGASWERVDFVYFTHELTLEDLKGMGISDEVLKDMAFDDSSTSGRSDTGRTKSEREDSEKGILKTLTAHEIWDKPKGQVLFITPQYKRAPLSKTPDPLNLPGFFPVPKPLQPLKKRKSLQPICPYKVYQTQVEELEQITKRIASLISQLKVRGLLGGEMAKDLDMVKSLRDGEYAPVENAAGFAGANTIEGLIAHWPLDPTVKALQQLYIQREQIKQTIYEVTGLSDILRGATDPNETLGAQNIKAQWGSQRIQRRQAEVARFARDIFRLKASIICSKFTSANLQAMTQIEVTPEVEEILRNDVMRAYRIDIEADSTVRADMARTQEQMNLFLTATSNYTGAMTGIAQHLPEALPALVSVYESFARRFKLGKQAEDALEGLSQMAQSKAQAAQAQQGQPDPEMQKAQLEMQKLEQKAQLDQQGLQAKAAHEERMAQLAEQKAQLDIQIKLIELDIKKQTAMLDAQTKQQDAAFKAQERREEHQFAHAERAEEAAFNREERVENREMMRETNDVKREGMADKAKFDKQRMAQQAKAKPSNGASA